MLTFMQVDKYNTICLNNVKRFINEDDTTNIIFLDGTYLKVNVEYSKFIRIIKDHFITVIKVDYEQEKAVV